MADFLTHADVALVAAAISKNSGLSDRDMKAMAKNAGLRTSAIVEACDLFDKGGDESFSE